ncbi:exported hypothetical protein [Verrucomicrobia bacterium]|nr:exported hypothetical protein [Verrucomicrobiota bacterium]
MKVTIDRSYGLRLARGPLALPLVLALVCLASPAPAQIYSLNDGNSAATVSPNTQAGMSSWTVQGVNELSQQWFWYALGNNAPASIDTISPAAVSQPTANTLNTSYSQPGFNMSVGYTLTGGATVPVGQYAASDMGESIRINNTSASPLMFHFYEYSDFDLQGVPGPDTVILQGTPRGFNDAFQTYGTGGLTETIAAPPANEAEAANEFTTLAKLNGGHPVTLNNNPAAVGDVTWAFEWDFTLNPGTSFLISKDKYLSVQVVPEPSAVGLAALGLVAFAFRLRRKA